MKVCFIVRRYSGKRFCYLESFYIKVYHPVRGELNLNVCNSSRRTNLIQFTSFLKLSFSLNSVQNE